MQNRIIGILAAVHVGAIVVGTLITSFMVKTTGYGAPNFSKFTQMNGRSLWIRENGFYLVLVPIIWFAYALWNESRNERKNRFSLTSGMIILVLLMALFWDTILNSHVRQIWMPH